MTKPTDRLECGSFDLNVLRAPGTMGPAHAHRIVNQLRPGEV